MRNLGKFAAAGALALAAVAGSALSSVADPAGGTAASGAMQILSPCTSAPTGYAACFVRVVKPAGLGQNTTSVSGASSKPEHTIQTFANALDPAQITAAYGWSASDVDTGTGKTIALVDAYNDPTIASNLTTFSAQFGLPACTTASGCFTQVSQTGSTTSLPKNTADWDVEISLDVEWAHAMAPKAHILLVEATSNSDANLFDAVTYAAQHAQYVSMSWGGSESSTETTYDKDFTSYPSVSFFASSGDSKVIEYPSASPDVVAVGGTTLDFTKTADEWLGETPWQTAGSGCSQYETASTAQKGFATYDQTGVPCTTHRATPDVAADANPTTGVLVYDTVTYDKYGPGWWQVGGTSVASPLVASHSAAAAVQVNQTFVYGSNLPFYDVNGGTKSSGTTPSTYSCVVGYNLCDGLGVWNTAHGTVNQPGQPPPHASLSFTSAATATFARRSRDSFTVTTSGDPVPTITESGSLPRGVSFKAGKDGTATISGNPTTARKTTYKLKLTATNGVAEVVQTFTLTVS